MRDGSAPVTPHLVVFSSLFPSPGQPQAGLFIRERMFRVAEHLPLVVVSPQPWFPLQGLIRRWRPGYRAPQPGHEKQQGIDVYRPRFFALPGVGRRFDGFFMALGAWRIVRHLRHSRGVNLIDAHFAYPDGYAASLLSRWLKLPLTITLRGTEARLCREAPLRRRILKALDHASEVIAVANSLKDVVVAAGARPERITRVGNGVDSQRFSPVPRDEARSSLGLAKDDVVLVSVGGLVPRKGFHRVIEVLPELLLTEPNIKYLVVGGASPEGNFKQALEAQVTALGLQSVVRFLGPVASAALREPLSAADVFVLSTENEGWANVFLEAMACGLPVVTTRVGGNAEVLESEHLGRLVPFGDPQALTDAIRHAIATPWDRAAIRAHAEANDWSHRMDALTALFYRATGGTACR